MFPYTSRLAYGGGMTDNMLDDNVLGSVDNQENVEAHHEREHDPRRRRRRDTVLHQPQPNINQVSCAPATDSWSLPMLPLSATCVFVQAVGDFGGVLTTMFLYRNIPQFSLIETMEVCHYTDRCVP